MLLQAYYEVEKVRKDLLRSQQTPDLTKIRKVLFWDTNIDQIDWQKQKRAVIQRIFERGKEAEIKEIISFYGESIVTEELKLASQFLPALAENAEKYLSFTL